MEPNGTLLHLEVPATCPYPEPAQSSPYAYILLPEDPSSYYPLVYAWVAPVIFSLRFSPVTLYTPLPSPIRATCPAHLILDFYHPHKSGWGVQIIKFFIMLLCDKWVPVPTAWRVLTLRMEERPLIWRVATNVLNKQSRTADKGWSSSLGFGRGANKSSPWKRILLRNRWDDY
jgi:hypothetical protein